MANDWLRLWHDMPTDPKWRVIARASNQPISLVIALYTAMLVDASKNVSRGVTKCHDEDFAVTLDCDITQIAEIKTAMQGRVLDGNKLTGWEIRQPKKEDSGNPETGAKSAAERKREQRERDRLADDESIVTQCHEASRNVTIDTDKDTEKEEKKKPLRNAEHRSANAEAFAEFWNRYPRKKNKGDAEKAWKKLSPDAGLVAVILEAVEVAQAGDDWRKDSGKFVPYPASWLNAKGWADEVRKAEYSPDEAAVMADYNRILGPKNWPEAVLTPYSPERAASLREFLDFGKKPGWVHAYLEFVADSLEAKPGLGLDWVIRRETYLRCREGNFASLREAA